MIACRAINPVDVTREHCTCTKRGQHGFHRCGCGYEWAASDEETDAQFDDALYAIRKAEHRAFLMIRDIHIGAGA